jgi:hypothetical protein
MRDRAERAAVLGSHDVPVTSALRQLRRLTMIAPALFVAAVEIIVHLLIGDRISEPLGVITTIAIVFAGSAFFAVMIFNILRRIQSRLVQRNRQIAAVHSAGISLASEMMLERPPAATFREITNEDGAPVSSMTTAPRAVHHVRHHGGARPSAHAEG